MVAFLCIYNPLVALAAGAVMAWSGEAWWAYGLATLGAFNLATQLAKGRP